MDNRHLEKKKQKPLKFKKIYSHREINVNINKYIIDWNYAVSKPQKAFKDLIYPYWKCNIVLEEFRIPGSKLRCDIVNLTKRIIAEISPQQHFSYNKFFHGSRSGFIQAMKRDVDKIQWAEDNNFRLIEITEKDIANFSKEYIIETFGDIL